MSTYWLRGKLPSLRARGCQPSSNSNSPAGWRAVGWTGGAGGDRGAGGDAGAGGDTGAGALGVLRTRPPERAALWSARLATLLRAQRARWAKRRLTWTSSLASPLTALDAPGACASGACGVTAGRWGTTGAGSAGGSCGSSGVRRGHAATSTATATSATARATLPQRTRACSGGARFGSMVSLGAGPATFAPGQNTSRRGTGVEVLASPRRAARDGHRRRGRLSDGQGRAGAGLRAPVTRAASGHGGSEPRRAAGRLPGVVRPWVQLPRREPARCLRRLATTPVPRRSPARRRRPPR